MLSGILLSLLLTLQIPSHGIETNLSEGCSQAIVNQKNTAAIYDSDVYGIGNAIVIADHNNQDFSTLKYVEVGDEAYISTEEDVITLRCIEVCEGQLDSIGYILVDGDYMENRYENAIIMYTCMKKKGHRVVTYWEVVE